MPLFSDTVPRWVYDELKADYKDLLERYHALRPTHASPLPPKPGRVVAGPDAEAIAAKKLHDSVIENIAEAIESSGIAPDVAKKEAARLRAVALGTDGIP